MQPEKQAITMGSMATRPKRPRDTNQLAKRIVDISIGEAKDASETEGKNAAAVSLGKRGGMKGGAARAKKLSSEERAAIAKKAALSRWSKTERASTSGPEKAKKVKVSL